MSQHVQDEVRWVLDTIRDNWPGLSSTGLYGEGLYGEGLYYGEWPTDDDGIERLYRVHRDEPEILETGERTLEVELSRASVLGASLGSRNSEVAGPDNRRRVTTAVDCRLKAMIDSEYGHVESNNDAKRLALYAKNTLDNELSYPDVDPDAEEIGKVAYRSATVGDVNDRSQEWMDEYFWTWQVTLIGYESI